MRRSRAWWRIEIGPRAPAYRQRLLPFLERSNNLARRFKAAILILTIAAVAAALFGTPSGRYLAERVSHETALAAKRVFGIPPDRAEVDAVWQVKRQHLVGKQRVALQTLYEHARPDTRRLFDVAGMAPQNGLIRWGRGDDVFLISSGVFEADDSGRSYRMRPNRRSVWLRQITLREGPFSMFLVPDTSDVRASATRVDAIVDEHSAQQTNSWGCRGPEPDPNATMRGVVLGDSFMLAMFNADDETPSVYLERALHDTWRVPVSILNTGHIGYAPEQYYHTLRQLGDRFRPHFVVVSVCPNDFGQYFPVLDGKGDGYDEASYWLAQIALWCRGRNIPCVLVPVVCESEVVGPRNDGAYPGLVNNLYEGIGTHYVNPVETFIDEHIKVLAKRWRQGNRDTTCALFNIPIADNHFSPLGAAVWGKVVADRVVRIDELQRATLPAPSPD